MSVKLAEALRSLGLPFTLGETDHAGTLLQMASIGLPEEPVLAGLFEGKVMLIGRVELEPAQTDRLRTLQPELARRMEAVLRPELLHGRSDLTLEYQKDEAVVSLKGVTIQQTVLFRDGTSAELQILLDRIHEVRTLTRRARTVLAEGIRLARAPGAPSDEDSEPDPGMFA